MKYRYFKITHLKHRDADLFDIQRNIYIVDIFNKNGAHAKHSEIDFNTHIKTYYSADINTPLTRDELRQHDIYENITKYDFISSFGASGEKYPTCMGKIKKYI